jgi:hypothetical protein
LADTASTAVPGFQTRSNALNEVEINQLVREYQAGRTLAELASEHGIHHRTIAVHLEARADQRRVNHRKMNDDDIREAARR